ncbi:MAG TPA: cytochrome c3 family protein [Myxococcota bacterium]|nr:cytochrome c3 family protein [Myxococcota bacterium]
MGAGRERSAARGARRARWSILLLGAAACATLSTGDLVRTHRSAAVEGASEKVGAETCTTCHDTVAGHAPAPKYHAECESCHGPGDKHAASADKADIRFPANADCQACHDRGHDTLIGWTTSEHQRAGVYCSDCHSAHGREPWHLAQPGAVARAVAPHATSVTQMCSACHPDVAATFELPSHHPLREGMLSCTDCHAPHGANRVALGAATARCSGCHQDYAGPWIYEHPPVTEDCGHCHAPHGTSSRALLETNEPGVCISCHTVAEAGAVHDPFAFSTRCSDCHSAVHGSYADPHLRR